MTGDHESRQRHLIQILSAAKAPIRGDDLAKDLGVTRQVVVHDIALLRAAGTTVVATPRGYYLEPNLVGQHQEILAVRHRVDQTADELYTLVDHGITVLNVLVEHPLYGEISAALRVGSRIDVDEFLEQVRQRRAHLLSDLTDGYHMHLVECRDRGHLQQAVTALTKRGIEVFL